VVLLVTHAAALAGALRCGVGRVGRCMVATWRWRPGEYAVPTHLRWDGKGSHGHSRGLANALVKLLVVHGARVAVEPKPALQRSRELELGTANPCKLRARATADPRGDVSVLQRSNVGRRFRMPSLGARYLDSTALHSSNRQSVCRAAAEAAAAAGLDCLDRPMRCDITLSLYASLAVPVCSAAWVPGV
jgi:hypothetical protein